MDMQDDLIKEFVAEAREHLADMESDLLAIEEAGADIDENLVNKVFRAAHSIKGGSSFFGLGKIKELAHKTETVLDMVRSRKMVPNPEITNVLLAAFDMLRDLINDIGASEEADISEHVAGLTQLANAHLPDGQKDHLEKMAVLYTEGDSQPVDVPVVDLERAKRTGQFIYRVEYDLFRDIERQGKSVPQVFKDLYASGEILDCAMDFDAVGTLDNPGSNRIPLNLTYASILEPDIISSLFEVEKEHVRLLFDPNDPIEGVGEEVAPAGPEEPAHMEPPETVAVPESEPPVFSVPQPEPVPAPDAVRTAPPPSSAKQESQESEGRGKAAGTSGESTLRVDVELLESLMNLAGELVLSRNQLREAVAQNDRRALVISSQRINLVTSELQDAIMQTRMQPVGNVFSKFPRVVRDMSHNLNKEIQLDIRGKDVELDKSLIEGLSDPLTHMVRNSVDHGIESHEERLRAGKKSTGTIRLEARHEAGQVVVEIADDGRGLDPQRIAASAVKKGLIGQEKLQGMSDKDKMALVFLPGLSTAEKVTDVSGRGVGMDVVKTNLDRLGGKVEIESEVGKGTLFRIKLPLTLAIIPSLIVTVQGDRFAIPQINVVELLRIRADQVKKRIEVVGDAEVLILREQIVPLVRFLRLPGGRAHLHGSQHRGTGNLPQDTHRGPAVPATADCRRRSLGRRLVTRRKTLGKPEAGRGQATPPVGRRGTCGGDHGHHAVRPGGGFFPEYRRNRGQASRPPSEKPPGICGSNHHG